MCPNVRLKEYSILPRARLSEVSLKPKVNRPISERKKERHKVYSTRKWNDLRKVQLAHDNGECQCCLSFNRIRLAEEVHHIHSFMDEEGVDMNYAYDRTNLISLCKCCHIAVHKGYVDISKVRGEVFFQMKDEVKYKKLYESLTDN